MWIMNKYYFAYQNLMNRARDRITPEGYCETHHVLPRSLGGCDDTSNLVLLTAREHFVCHQLLTKCTYGMNKKKMTYAAFLMAHGRGSVEFTVSSRTYTRLKKEMNENRKGNQPSLETRQKIREANTGKKSTDETRQKISTALTGLAKSDQTRTKMSEYWSGRKRTPHREDVKQRISETLKGRSGIKGRESPMLGKSHGDATRQKMRISQANVGFLACENCGASEIRPCHFGRWHGPGKCVR